MRRKKRREKRDKGQDRNSLVYEVEDGKNRNNARGVGDKALHVWLPP